MKMEKVLITGSQRVIGNVLKKGLDDYQFALCDLPECIEYLFLLVPMEQAKYV